MKTPIFWFSLLSILPIASSFSVAIAQPILTPSQNQLLQNFRQTNPAFSSFPPIIQQKPGAKLSPFDHENNSEPLDKFDFSRPSINWVDRDTKQPDCSLADGKVGQQYKIRDLNDLDGTGKTVCVPQEYSDKVLKYLDRQNSK